MTFPAHSFDKISVTAHPAGPLLEPPLAGAKFIPSPAEGVYSDTDGAAHAQAVVPMADRRSPSRAAPSVSYQGIETSLASIPGRFGDAEGEPRVDGGLSPALGCGAGSPINLTEQV